MAKKSSKTEAGVGNGGGEILLVKEMGEVMHQSMMPYAEHVILERALPRVEDGLKPVQRRILYTMLELGNTPDKPHRKSARIVGDCLGKYHPHGDSSVYDAMVRMAQDFNMSMPLVDGHGNFGSVDGDSAAAMRYTEARMMPLALEVLRDIDKDTVKFSLNFDDTLKEPDLLPGRFPNLIVNGATGIAVGLATNIPPHNLREAIDATIAMIKNPEISCDELMKIIPCPDFPTGGYILNSDEIAEAYRTGRAKITVRAKAHIEEQKNGKQLIVITELPYQTNKAKLLSDILELSQEKKTLFAGISDIRDESDRQGMRAVIEVRKGADAEKTLQYLYKYSELQTTFGVNMVAIADGKPQQLSLKQMLSYYIKHQEDVVTRRTEFDLENAKRRMHILEGLMIAIDNIDEVIRLIRASKTPKIAREALMNRFGLSEMQAQAILDLRLQRLTNLEMLSIEKEYKDTAKLISGYEAILSSKAKLFALIIDELTEIGTKYGIPRRTQLIDGERRISIPEEETKIADEAIVMVLPDNKLRRVAKRSFNKELAVEERPVAIFDTTTDKRLKLFMNSGACLSLQIEDIPETKLGTRATSLASLIALEEGETVVRTFVGEQSGKLFFYSKHGYIKCLDAAELNTKQKRIAATSVKDGDELIGVEPESEESVVLITKNAMSIRFMLSDVPVMGRVSVGVRGIKLDDGDEVIFAAQIPDMGELLLVSERGYMKRSFTFDYELQNRYGKGVKTFDFKKNGANGTRLVAVFHIMEPETLVAEQLHGTVTEFNTDDIMIEQRFSKGKPVIMAVLDDIITSVSKK